MPLFTVDETKCLRDKICIKECPMQIIIMKSTEETPIPAAMAEQICINCGHCVAVCPSGALKLNTMDPAACEPLGSDWNPGHETISKYMKSRRSIRKFKKNPVEKDKIEELIKVAAHAPSGHNSRPVQWTVFNDSEKIKDIAGSVIGWMNWMKENQPEAAKAMHFDMITKAWEFGIDVVTYNSPAIVIAHGSKKNPHAQIGCTIALSHLEVAAPSFGLGCCWGGFLTWAAGTWEPLKEKLGLPEGHVMHGSMLVGYPQFRYHRVPVREAKINWK